MQVEKLSETLNKFTLSQNDFNVNMIASIGSDGILLVDTGWEATAEGVRSNIEELSTDIIKLIIITHPHLDHIGGRHILGENATLISHKHTQDELAGRYYTLDPLPGGELPTILIEAELTLHFNGEEIRIIPAPGHTKQRHDRPFHQFRGRSYGRLAFLRIVSRALPSLGRGCRSIPRDH